jgi:hypothetical protein
MKHTEAEILEYNDLLAGFMNISLTKYPTGFETYVGEGLPYTFADNLRYHESWDWLFPIIDKINGMGKEYQFATFKTYVSLTVEKSGNKMYKDFSFANSEYITAEQTSKEAAYKLLIKFIKWHNEHKQL